MRTIAELRLQRDPLETSVHRWFRRRNYIPLLWLMPPLVPFRALQWLEKQVSPLEMVVHRFPTVHCFA